MKKTARCVALCAALTVLCMAQALTAPLTGAFPGTVSASDATHDPEEVHKMEPAPRENIILNAYLVPMYDETTRRAQLALCRDANIDVLSHVYPAEIWKAEDHTVAWYKNAMAEAAEYGLKLQTRETRLQNCLSLTDAQVIALAKEYKDLPGFGGFYVVDEPVNPSIYAHTENLLRSVCPDTLVNVNFLPRGAYGENYVYQLSDYGSLLTYGGTLSLDTYNFGPNGGVDENGLFGNYEDLRRAGLMTGSDTAVYVQSVGSPNQYGYRRPSPSDLRYNMMAALAYGVKEIKFFTWGTPGTHEGNYTEAIIGRDGKPTDLYDDVCAINAYVHTIGRYIAACDVTAIYHTRQNSAVYTVIPDDLFIKPLGNAIVSLMEERGGDAEYVMLVNKDIEKEQTLTCTVKGITSLETVNGEGKLVPLAIRDGRFTLTLAAGDSAIIKLPKGDFIKATVSEDADLALSATVTATAHATTSDAGMYLYKTYDGVRDGGGVRLTSPDGAPQSITFDLGRATSVNRVDVSPARAYELCGAHYPSEFVISTSADGKSWQVAATVAAGDVARPIETVPTFRFDPVNARFVRLTVTGFATENAAFELGDISIYNDDGSIPAGEKTFYKAPVYDPSTNLALHKPIAGYSSTTDQPAWSCHHTYLTDGAPSTAWASELFRNDRAESEEWITVDLLNLYEINRIILTPRDPGGSGSNAFPNDYRIDVSTDGVTFETVAERTMDNHPVAQEQRVLEFDAVSARYVRLYATRLTTFTGAGGGGFGVEMSEMEIYGPGSSGNAGSTVLPEDVNVALHKPVVDYTSTVDVPDWNCHHDYLTDGTDKGWASGFNRHDTPEGEEWITIDLGEVFSVYKVALSPQESANGTNVFPDDYCIEVSTDGETFVKAVEVTADNFPQRQDKRVLSFEPVDARYVRFHATRLTIGSGAGVGYMVELDELEVFRTLAPAETRPEETGVPTDPEITTSGASDDETAVPDGETTVSDETVFPDIPAIPDESRTPDESETVPAATGCASTLAVAALPTLAVTCITLSKRRRLA